MKAAGKISARAFYAEYHGHPVAMLETLHARLREQGKKIVFLTGDSSLDNKHWLYPEGENKAHNPLTDDNFCGHLANGYESILEPPRGVKDVAWHMNFYLAAENSPYAVINAAVEESTTADRANGTLLEHDLFVQRNIRDDDIVIVSLGGNDIALRPTKSTMAAIGSLNFLTPQWMARRGWGLGFGHLGSIFKDAIQDYLVRLVGDKKCRFIAPCTIYYPCEHETGSWADGLLNTLGYSADSPTKLQLLIDACFEHFTSSIQVHDTPMRPIALSTVLDSKDAADYDNRVEPSVQGGAKMGERFAEEVQGSIK